MASNQAELGLRFERVCGRNCSASRRRKSSSTCSGFQITSWVLASDAAMVIEDEELETVGSAGLGTACSRMSGANCKSDCQLAPAPLD